MYISSCLAYNPINVGVETMDEHLNIKIEDEKTGNSFSITLSGPQAATLATGLIDVLMKTGERPDPLDIFGKAKLVRREAA
ncbi:MAG: hypothetical protein GYA36_05370 [Veillonellaceae bacterium]|nr:hypothetical protein [Veillonellaceae bacterium]